MVTENPEKHLEFIQGVITRMANNSFLLKGWTVTIVAALFALAAQNSNRNFVYLAFLPVLTFWALDAFYLWQERLYRRLYNAVRNGESADGPFSLDATPFKKDEKWFNAFCSSTISLFYLLMFASTCLVIGLTLT